MKRMKIFYNIDSEEDFENFMARQHDDDVLLKEKFAEYSHRQFNFCLINIGIMLDIVRGYFHFERDRITDDIMNLEKDKIRNRRINKIVRDLNEKINLRYEFDEDTMIVPSLAVYNNEAYLLIDKCLFVDLILEKAEIRL
ncbi:hypothetical protein [uncultured Methanobrevibacter sp.]|uniref:hypothetical protein n=1 Tax=uncultured Methanobrevibacter sp. TaxID=253161 RepID=UPI0025ECC347|nr:hypothetical protein [uncultured Methanobrevibacter sp.]